MKATWMCTYKVRTLGLEVQEELVNLFAIPTRRFTVSHLRTVRKCSAF